MFYCKDGASVYVYEDGSVFEGIWLFGPTKRWKFCEEYISKNIGRWEAKHDAYKHLCPLNIILWDE